MPSISFPLCPTFFFGRQHRRVLHARWAEQIAGVVALATRGWGKTAVSLHLAIQAALSQKSTDVSLWLTPVSDQFRSAWRALKQGYHRHIRRAVQSEFRVAFKGGGALEFRSAFEPDHLRGKTYRAVVLDEAALIPADGWHSCIRPTQRRAGDWYVLLTTPRGRDWVAALGRKNSRQEFASLFGEHRPEADTVPARLLRFPAQWTDRAGQTRFADNIDPRRLKAAQSELPETVFRREYLCESGIGVTLCFPDVEKHIDETLQPRPAAGTPEKEDIFDTEHRYVIGVDWGFAHDFTVACVLDLEQGAVVEIYRQHRVGSDKMAEAVATLARRYGDAYCLCDVTGLQDQALKLLQNQGTWAMGFVFTPQSKTDMIESLIVAWEHGRVKIPRHTALLNEFTTFESDYNPATRQRTYAAAPGSDTHDDCIIALALAWWAQANYPAPQQPIQLPPPIDWDRYFAR